jgi:Arc/MetJ-type ribon-helix-helix transcriptional regulator
LDDATARRLKHLSRDWNVSQAEVVRRAVQLAESALDKRESNPLSALKSLHANGGGLVREEAEAYLEEVRRDRRDWRDE